MNNLTDKQLKYKMIKASMIIMCSLLVLIFSGIVHADSNQPTQQYNKIYLNPFYRENLTSNTNYTYTVEISPPDRISKVNSVIISFNSQINGQSQNFTLLVNNQSCNNPNFYIATAFSTTGNTQFYFDCSNIITKSGNYTIKLRSTVNTGVINGWIDLTYMNNPNGNLQLSGTEYSPNDAGTIFTQLKDSYGNPVQNGNCYVDIYYPLTNGTHPYIIQDAPMIQAIGDDGLYYYDLTIPNQLGVYMLSAKCSYSYNYQWIYPFSENTLYPVRQSITGTWSGSEVSLNNPEDGIYDTCNSGTNCVANYTFNISSYGKFNNITNINLYWLGETTKVSTITFKYYNGTTFVNLPNTITTVATGSVTQPSGIDSLQTNSIPLNAIRNNDTIIIQVSEVTGSTHSYYGNWLGLSILTNYGTIQDVKGSSEMHVTNIPNATVSLSNSQIPLLVWNFTNRNLTYYQNFSSPQQDLTNYTLISQYINSSGNDVKLNITSLLNSMNNKLDNITSLFSTISSNVWSYINRTLSSFSFDNTDYTKIFSGIWNFTNRNLTYYPNMTVNINTTVLTVQNVTVITQNVTVQNVTVNVNNVSVITQNVTVNNVTVNVNNYTINTQNVTVNNVSVNVNNYTLNIQNVSVNNYTINVNNVTVTQNNYTINVTTQNVIVNNVSIDYNIISDYVWNNTGRYVHGVLI
jgi:hypothetical protein